MAAMPKEICDLPAVAIVAIDGEEDGTAEIVTDTIGEVEKTLAEAFVLVVIVVFLFLGSIRLTANCRTRSGWSSFMVL